MGSLRAPASTSPKDADTGEALVGAVGDVAQTSLDYLRGVTSMPTTSTGSPA